jgi:DNA-binding IclR family transcriptional regulator
MEPTEDQVVRDAGAELARSGGPRSHAAAGRTVQSLERAFAILEAIAGSDQPLSLAELSRTTGLHTSTAFHLIKTLIVLGYIRQEDTKRYRIGPRLFMQAAGASTEVELVNLATPHLKRLADETGETAHLAVRADTGIAVIAKVEARSSIRTSERLGIIRPAALHRNRQSASGRSSGRRVGSLSARREVRRVYAKDHHRSRIDP